VREAATIYPGPCKLTFDLLTMKVVSESRVTWATSVPILVFLGLSVQDLGPGLDWPLCRGTGAPLRRTQVPPAPLKFFDMCVMEKNSIIALFMTHSEWCP